MKIINKLMEHTLVVFITFYILIVAGKILGFDAVTNLPWLIILLPIWFPFLAITIFALFKGMTQTFNSGDKN